MRLRRTGVRGGPLPLLLALSVSLVLVVLPPSGAGAAGAEEDPVGVWPLLPVPEVVHDFDPPATTYGSGHRGVDLSGSVGATVRTALPGTVSFAGPLAGRGVVVVDHGDTRTTYEPVEATVAVGDVVAAGDRIGTLTLALSHCLPAACLHWGWLRGETYLDPLLLVGGGPIRLLPWGGAPATGTVESAVAARSTAPAAGVAPTPPLLWAAAGLMPWGVPAGRPGGADRW